jgi:hypothetical protein
MITANGVKGEVFRVHAMKAYRGRRGITLLIHNLGTKCSELLTSRTGRFTRE